MTDKTFTVAGLPGRSFQLVPEKLTIGLCGGCINRGGELSDLVGGGMCRRLQAASKEAGLGDCMSAGQVYADAPAKAEPVLLTEDPDHGDAGVAVQDAAAIEAINLRARQAAAHKPVHGGYPEGPAMPLASHQFANDKLVQALARVNDPETSKAAAKAVNVGGGKLVDLILQLMQDQQAYAKRISTEEQGYTGKELSERLGKPLNSITPRFAPLRKAGLIHASGTRDKQAVWKLGNGVKL